MQDQHPEFLKIKARKINWKSDRARAGLEQKMAEIVESTRDFNEAIARVKAFLNKLLTEDFFESTIYGELIQTFQNCETPNCENQNYKNQNYKNQNKKRQTTVVRSTSLPIQPSKIAVLLLDAENLQLDLKTEQAIANLCPYPLQVKIAFADWRRLGELDRELHARGYDLIQVPGGRDHADGKMIAVGSSILSYYPMARAVFVCSSDTVMTNLCNNLQKNGLRVYRVSRKSDIVEVFDYQSDRTRTISIDLDIPSLREFNSQLQEMVRQEQQSIQNPWVKLSRLSQRFQETTQLTLAQVISYYFPDKKVSEFFAEYSEEVVIYRNSKVKEAYVTLFQVDRSGFQGSPQNSTATGIPSAQNAASIESSQTLEKILLQLLEELIEQGGDRIKLNILGASFKKKYGERINQVVKRLNDGSTKFLYFIKNSDLFEVQKQGNTYDIYIRDRPRESHAEINVSDRSRITSLQASAIASQKELESVLLEIIKNFSPAGQNSIIIENLSGEFSKQYGQGVTKVLKRLKLHPNFVKFLEKSSIFQIKKSGKSYIVSARKT
ncbi:hypothetical protein [Baaleninema sp.]|uniref:hypothetical protein n=1 Tax=Baaleninema sp. TaxID=3101197 RepID=UPI003D040543